MLSVKNKKVIIICISLIFFTSILFVNRSAVESDLHEIVEYDTNNDPDAIISSYGNFTDYKNITIDHTKVVGSGAHANFPVLISILDSELHENCQSEGYDIAFYNGSIQLDHEIEYFNLSYFEYSDVIYAKLVAWVQVPFLSTSVHTNITMCYGNSTMGPQENPEGVWDSNYRGVWHLEEKSGPTAYDSTSNNFDGGHINDVKPQEGKIGSAQSFDGTCYIDTDINATELGVEGNTNRTASVWVYIKDFNNASVFDVGNNSAAQEYSLRVVDTVNNWRCQHFINENDINFQYNSINKWVFFTMTYDGAVARIYANGEYLTEKTVALNTQNERTTFRIGKYAIGSEPDTFFNGIIDEMRILNTTRSAGWIATEYNNQNNPNSFYYIETGQYIPETEEEENDEQQQENGNGNSVVGDDIILFSLAIIGATIIGAGVIVMNTKRKSAKYLQPPRKKIPFKEIITHINLISKKEQISEKHKIPKKIEGSKNEVLKKETKSLKEKNEKLEPPLEEVLSEREQKEKKLEGIQTLGDELFAEGAYYEALKQYELTEKLLVELEREDEALIYSDLIGDINKNIGKREKALEILEKEIQKGDFMRIFNVYYVLLEISKKLHDDFMIEQFQSELIQIFKEKKINIAELEIKKSVFEENANKLFENREYDNAAKYYRQCERLSRFLFLLGKGEELDNAKDYRKKKKDSLQKNK